MRKTGIEVLVVAARVVETVGASAVEVLIGGFSISGSSEVEAHAELIAKSRKIEKNKKTGFFCVSLRELFLLVRFMKGFKRGVSFKKFPSRFVHYPEGSRLSVCTA